MKAPAILVHCQSQCGESPIWDPETRLLSWIDTENPRFSTLDPSSGTTETATTPWLVQAIGRARARLQRRVPLPMIDVQCAQLDAVLARVAHDPAQQACVGGGDAVMVVQVELSKTRYIDPEGLLRW